MSLDELLRAFREGKSRAEHRLFRRLNIELLRYFKRRVNLPDAEDLTQQTLEIIARELGDFEPEEERSFRSFVFAIAHYRLLSHRKLGRRGSEPPGRWVAAPDPIPDDVTLIEEQATLVRRAMATIKTSFRRALESRLREEEPRVFAASEGIKTNTVRSRVHRAITLVAMEIQAQRKTPCEAPPTPT